IYKETFSNKCNSISSLYNITRILSNNINIQNKFTQSEKNKNHDTKNRWMKDGKEKLMNTDEQRDVKMSEVTACFPDPNDVQRQQKWQKIANPEIVKGDWSKEEDEKVIELVKKYDPKRWTMIAKHLKGRISKQCREHWINHLKVAQAAPQPPHPPQQQHPSMQKYHNTPGSNVDYTGNH
ncbi:unnamed protein product, partial [Meganyctiphanes norvegica]